ncbi:hypothetical protein AAVH_31030 [Aphelenchoides avenae]|nr:hypothetical protein AAVH_31030 [Aphelenchus avenae]
MPNLAQSLADVQAEFDKKTQLADELTEKLRLQVADTSELKRQLDKVYEHLTEQTLKATAAESGPVEAADKNTGPTSRRDKLSNDALLDVFTFLNRFNVDAAHIAYRQGRYVVEKMLTTQCLRELTYVTLKRVEKPHVDPEGRRDNWASYASSGFRSFNSPVRSGQRSERFLKPSEDADWGFVVSFGRSGEAAARLGNNPQEEMHRRLTFQSVEAAGDYLLRLIRSSTIDDFTLENLVPAEAFFKELHSVAATVSVKKLALSGCHLEDVDANTFQQALLRFHSVHELLVGFRLLPGQISDGFLSAAGDKLALTQLHYDTDGPTDAWTVTFGATEYGIMQFLFQRTEKPVQLQISHVNVSKTFCRGLFLKALLEPAANDLCLAMRFDNLKQDLTGVLDWHFPELDYSSWGSCKKEIYSVKARLGKRLRLAIDKKPCGRLSSLEFRRSSAFGREEEAVYNQRSDNDAAPNYL